jgi:hypothetical protein
MSDNLREINGEIVTHHPELDIATEHIELEHHLPPPPPEVEPHPPPRGHATRFNID